MQFYTYNVHEESRSGANLRDWLNQIFEPSTSIYQDHNINSNWLVVSTPLWKIWKSIGMIIPNIWEK